MAIKSLKTSRSLQPYLAILFSALLTLILQLEWENAGNSEINFDYRNTPVVHSLGRPISPLGRLAVSHGLAENLPAQSATDLPIWMVWPKRSLDSEAFAFLRFR